MDISAQVGKVLDIPRKERKRSYMPHPCRRFSDR